MAGVRGWELRAPLATYTPWNLRWGYDANPEELTDFRGTYIPLAWDEAERALWGDPRPSIEALYPDEEAYLGRVRAATRDLVREGFLLPQDAGLAVDIARTRWEARMGGEG
jgi:hypothetical protein